MGFLRPHEASSGAKHRRVSGSKMVPFGQVLYSIMNKKMKIKLQGY